MNSSVTILGCQSATPRVNSHTTSQVLLMKNRHFLIDCGEGTQVQLRKYKFSFAKFNHIFISHLHGDHFFGLIGLLSTFALHGREKTLHIYAPKGLEEVINLQFEVTQSKSRATFTIEFHELSSAKSELIFEDKKVEVYTIPLKHRIYTNGFLFKEKTEERTLNIDAVRKYPEIEVCDYHNIKKGKDFVREDSSIIENSILTFDPPKPKSYAFCSDTSYLPSIVEIVKNVDLLYHESTFLEDRKDMTIKTGHSTAKEAATIAKMANAKKLILGHFSSRYFNLDTFKSEAQEVFENVIVANDGLNVRL